YRIGSSPSGHAVIEWVGPVPETAEDLVTAPPRSNGPPPAALAEAQALLHDLLGPGPAACETVQQLALEAGIASRTLERAKNALDVRSFHKHANGRQVWYWSLPEAERSSVGRSAQEPARTGTGWADV